MNCCNPITSKGSYQILQEEKRPLVQNSTCSLKDKISEYARKKIISYFYAGYREHPPEVARERRNGLIQDYNGIGLECEGHNGKIDALLLKNTTELRTGNVLVICLNTTYQDHHPRHWKPFFEYGADILLWNPTSLGPRKYSYDLNQLLQVLRKQNDKQVIAIAGYCMGTDPSILAVSQMNDPNIHLIIDRGHGNAPMLARSLTFLAKAKLISDILDEECNCYGIEKIQRIQGKKLFVLPGTVDQIMNYGKQRNFTHDLIDQLEDTQEVTIEGGDHWSGWDYQVYSKVLEFLSEIHVVHSGEEFHVDPKAYPIAQPLSYWQKKLLPFKLQSKATCGCF